MKETKINDDFYFLTVLSLVALVILLVFPNPFSKVRMVMSFDENSGVVGVVSSDKVWDANFKEEYFAVFSLHDFFVQDHVPVVLVSAAPVQRENVTKLVVSYGNIVVSNVLRSTSFSDYNGFWIETSSFRVYFVLLEVFYFVILAVFARAVYLLRGRFKKIIWQFVKKIHFVRPSQSEIIAHLGVLCFAAVIGIVAILLKMSLLEALFMTLFLFILGCALLKYNPNLKVVCFLVFLSLYSIYISVNNITAYLLVDEPRAINEQLELSSDIFRHWYFGYSRINYALMGTLLKAVPNRFLASINSNGLMWAKILHWFVAMLFLLLLCSKVVKHCVSRRTESKLKRQITLVLLLQVFLSIPVLLDTLKFYNYDTFAVLLGMLGVFYLYISIRDKSQKYAFIAYIVLSLGLQEKNIVAPFFALGAVNLTYWIVANHKEKIKNKIQYFQELVKDGFLVIAIFLCVAYFVNCYVTLILRDARFSIVTLQDLYLPITSLTSKLVMTVLGGGVSNIVIILVTTLLIEVGVIVCVCMIDFMNLHNFFEHKKQIGNSVFALIVVTFVLGVICTYVIKEIYLDLAYENSENYYISSIQLTALTIYFPVHSLVKSIIYSIGALISLCVNAIPTAYTVGGLFLLFYYRSKNSSLLNLLYLFTALLIPIAYGVLGLTPVSRYVNIYVSVMVLILTILMSEFITEIELKRIVYVLPVIVLSFAEIVGFGPLYYSFWPIWNVVPYQYEKAEPGVEVLGWQGGIGEHIGIVGKMIEKYCKKNGIEDAKIYTNYHGYSTPDFKLSVSRMPGYRKSRTVDFPEITMNKFRFDEDAFYVFSRWGITCATVPYDVPYEMEPVLKIERRGCVEVWVYSGPQMKEYLSKVEGLFN